MNAPAPVSKAPSDRTVSEGTPRTAHASGGAELLPLWLEANANTLRAKASEIQRQIDACKTEWWPSQLAVLRDAHLTAADVYTAALAKAQSGNA